MTEQKWIEIYDINANQFSVDLTALPPSSPHNWPEARKIIMNMVNAMDEATEVYNMENANGKT